MLNKIFLLFVTFTLSTAMAQEGFKEEVNQLNTKYNGNWDSAKETIVFTGSSSIRMWKNVQDFFPKHQIINTGFGGSKASDLLFYTQDLILKYKPSTVFIYEGDNDVADAIPAKTILLNLKNIIAEIQNQNPNTTIILLAAKPSITRWHLKRKYKQLNRKIKRISKKDTHLRYANVWKPMLIKRKLNETLFISDGLHMNAAGYQIWYNTLKDYLN